MCDAWIFNTAVCSNCGEEGPFFSFLRESKKKFTSLPQVILHIACSVLARLKASHFPLALARFTTPLWCPSAEPCCFPSLVPPHRVDGSVRWVSVNLGAGVSPHGGTSDPPCNCPGDLFFLTRTCYEFATKPASALRRCGCICNGEK